MTSRADRDRIRQPVTVRLINSYRMRTARDEIDQGNLPANHLWGLYNPPSNVKVHVSNLCFNRVGEKYPALRGLTQFVEKVAGDPFQSLWALAGRRRRGTVVFSANPKTGTIVGLARRIRIVPVIYIVLVHSWPISKWAKISVRGADRIICFSDQVAEQVRADLGSRTPVTALPWGPDLNWRGYTSKSQEPTLDFVAAGKTNRDYSGLESAALNTNMSGSIHDGTRRRHYRNGMLTSEMAGRTSYAELMREMGSTRNVVIPLRDMGQLTGLTELADALALRIPIVMNRAPWMPFDLEDEGVGTHIDSSTAEEIVRAIRENANLGVSSSCAELLRRYNLDLFQAGLIEQFHLATAARGDR